MPRTFPVQLTYAQLSRIIELLKNQSDDLSAAIDALNAPNVKSDAALYRKLTNAQDDIIEAGVE